MNMPSSAQAVRRRLQNTPTKTRTVSGEAPSPKRARLGAPNDSPTTSPTKGPLKQSAEENSASFVAVSFYGLKKNKTVKENVPSGAERSESDSDKSSNASGPLAKLITESNKSTCQRSHLDKLMLEKIALSPVKQAFLQTCTLAEFRKVYRNEYKELEEGVKRADVRVTRQTSQILNKKTQEDSSEDTSDEEDTREQDLNSETKGKFSSEVIIGSSDSQPLNGNSIMSPRRNRQRMTIKDKSHQVNKKMCTPGDNEDNVSNVKLNSPVLNNDTDKRSTENVCRNKINKQSSPKISTPPSSERRFFKTRSPLENTKKGVAVLTKGFGLKFMSTKPKTAGNKKNGSSRKRQPESHSPRIVQKVLAQNDSASRKSNRMQKTNSVEPVSSVSGFTFAPGFLSPEKGAREKPTDEDQREDDNEGFSLNRSSCSTYSSASQNPTAAEVIDNWSANDSRSANDPTAIHSSENSSHRAGERQPDLSVRKNLSGGHVLNQDGTPHVGDEGQSSSSSHKLFPIFERRNDQPTSSNKKRSSALQLNDTSPVSTSSKLPKNSNNSQMIIDAGQKKFGVTQCQVCNMVYCHADPVDEAAHAKFHRQHQEALKFTGWKKERVVQEYPEDLGRVILVMPDDPKYVRKKVDEVNQLMGRELGFPDTSAPIHPYHKVFLYVEDKHITGCCVAEPVHEGYRIIPGNLDNSQESGQRPWCCSPVSEPVCVGISRLWVAAERRKSGVATKLVDCVRQWFNYGSLIPKQKVAFSDPTPDGRRFAQKYTGTAMFLVYKYNYG